MANKGMDPGMRVLVGAGIFIVGMLLFSTVSLVIAGPGMPIVVLPCGIILFCVARAIIKGGDGK